jgi:hypothetical protein
VTQVVKILNYLAAGGRGAALIRNFDLDVVWLVGDVSVKQDLIAIARRYRDPDQPVVFSDGRFVGGKVGPAHVAIVALDGTIPVGDEVTSRVEKGCALLSRIVTLPEPDSPPSSVPGGGGTGAPAEVSISIAGTPTPTGRKPPD